MPDEPDAAERARRAAGALAQAKADALARGEAVVSRGRPGAPAGSTAGPGAPAAEGAAAAATGGSADPGRRRRGQAARPRRARRDDPQPLRAAIGGLLSERGWQDELAVGGVFGRWDQIVGAELAAHTRPDAFSGGELLVTADSTAWATQLRLYRDTLLARINEELGGRVVRRVKVRGPAPPPQAGPWRVRGGRGPRGDYG